MDLLLERKQTSAPFTLIPLQIGGGVMFTLWIKAELDQEETELLRKYRLSSALIIARDRLPALIRALRASAILGIIVGGGLHFLTDPKWAIGSGAAVMLLMTIAYYNELREHIYVRDLVHGRTFRCFSIVELLRKEEYLHTVSMYLRQVLESAKQWDGREIVDIPVLDREEAAELVRRGIPWH